MNHPHPKLSERLLATESLVDGRLMLRQAAAIPFAYAPVREIEQKAVAALAERAPDVLYTEIDTIHGDSVTLNYTFYPNASLRGDGVLTGYASFLAPYPKPLIKNHDQMTEPLGRAWAAKYVEENLSGTVVGIPRVTYAVTDPTAITKVLDGSYLTTSIGSRTDHFYCSICGADWLDPEAFEQCALVDGHYRGGIFDGQLMYLRLGNFENQENSFVNVPADQRAGVRQPSIHVGLGSESYFIGDPELVRRLTTSIHPVCGLKESVSMKPTLGQLFGLPETHERFAEEGPWTDEELAALPAESFAFDDRRFPLLDPTLATAMTEFSLWAQPSDETGSEEEGDAELAGEPEAEQGSDEAVAGEDDQATAEAEAGSDDDSSPAEAAEEVARLTAENADLRAQVAALEGEREADRARLTELAEATRTLLAETVARLQAFFGDAESYEAAHGRLETRSTESLQDTLGDLFERAQRVAPTTAAGTPVPTPSMSREDLLELIQRQSSLANLPILGESPLDNQATEQAAETVVIEEDEETILFSEDGKSFTLHFGLSAEALESLNGD
jgi:hypothetical protein